MFIPLSQIQTQPKEPWLKRGPERFVYLMSRAKGPLCEIKTELWVGPLFPQKPSRNGGGSWHGVDHCWARPPISCWEGTRWNQPASFTLRRFSQSPWDWVAAESPRCGGPWLSHAPPPPGALWPLRAWPWPWPRLSFTTSAAQAMIPRASVT